MGRLIGTLNWIVSLFQTSSTHPMNTIPIRAVLFEEAGVWCAQCLEHDIAAEADTFQSLKLELEYVLSVQAERSLEKGELPFASIPPAPAKFFRLYEQFERERGHEDSHAIPLNSPVASCVVAQFAYPEMVTNL